MKRRMLLNARAIAPGDLKIRKLLQNSTLLEETDWLMQSPACSPTSSSMALRFGPRFGTPRARLARRIPISAAHISGSTSSSTMRSFTCRECNQQ